MRLGEKTLARFLARHHYCGRKTPGELLDKLRAAPAGRAGEIEADAAAGSCSRSLPRCDQSWNRSACSAKYMFQNTSG